MVVVSEASWKASRSPLATNTVPPRLVSAAAAAGSEKIIGLEAGRLAVNEAARSHKSRQDIKLVDDFVIVCPAALVGGKLCGSPVRCRKGIPSNHHGAGLLLVA